MKKLIISLIILIIIFIQEAFAAENEEFSLTLCYEYHEKGIDGIEVSLYKIANIFPQYEDYYYEIVDELIDCKEEYVRLIDNQKEISNIDLSCLNISYKAKTDDDGIINIFNIEPGIYVVVNECIEGRAVDYEAFKQYVVTVPSAIEESYIKDVTIYSKVSSKPKEKPMPETGDNYPLFYLWVIMIISFVAFIRKKPV